MRGRRCGVPGWRTSPCICKPGWSTRTGTTTGSTGRSARTGRPSSGPVFVIAGWADGYRNAPAEILAHLTAPCWAMTGPWIHKYPHFAYPHPRADFIGLSLDWWHQWLSGEDRGVEAWPKHRAYRLEGVRPRPWRAEDPGNWVDTAQGVRQAQLKRLGPNGVLGSQDHGTVRIATPQHCGTTGGEFFTSAPDAYLPTDQRTDDGMSVCWDTNALRTPLDLAGRAKLKAMVAIDQPHGNLIARLCDVHPDGTSTLIARGVLNLCHRNSQENPEPMVPGQTVPVELTLDECCYRVPAGHRLRLALSTAYWPIILPSPAPISATLSEAIFSLPLISDAPEIAVPAPADPDPMPAYKSIETGADRRWTEHDLQAGRVRYHIQEDSGLKENPHTALQFRDTRDEVWEIDPTDPLSCRGELTFTTTRQRGAWQAETDAHVWFTTTPTHYEVEAELAARSGDDEIVRKNWKFSVPRNLV